MIAVQIALQCKDCAISREWKFAVDKPDLDLWEGHLSCVTLPSLLPQSINMIFDKLNDEVILLPSNEWPLSHSHKTNIYNEEWLSPRLKKHVKHLTVVKKRRFIHFFPPVFLFLISCQEDNCLLETTMFMLGTLPRRRMGFVVSHNDWIPAGLCGPNMTEAFKSTHICGLVYRFGLFQGVPRSFTVFPSGGTYQPRLLVPFLPFSL